MQSPIRKLSLIQRKSNTQIDVQETLKVIAKELITWSDEERRLRTSRRYRKAIRAVFAQYSKGIHIPLPALIALAMRDHLKVSADNWEKISEELTNHIRLNRTGYLRVQSGKNGGVFLAPKP